MIAGGISLYGCSSALLKPSERSVPNEQVPGGIPRPTKLRKASSLDAFLDENEDSFVTLDFISELNRVFKEKGISKAALAKKAGVSDVFLYQIFQMVLLLLGLVGVIRRRRAGKEQR